eukprot:5712176-Prorocentrum_lima.AAC.1
MISASLMQTTSLSPTSPPRTLFGMQMGTGAKITLCAGRALCTGAVVLSTLPGMPVTAPAKRRCGISPCSPSR